VSAIAPIGALGVESRRCLERIVARNPLAIPLERLPDVDPLRIPRHVAIIMDGNGRWARQQGFPREFGHRAGAGAVRGIVEECVKLGVEVLTLYSFSLENWKRPTEEVDALMQLCLLYLEGEREEMRSRGIRLRILGRRDGLPQSVLDAMDRACDATSANGAMTLCLAINYGARAEIVDAVRALARRVQRNELAPDAIDEAAISDALYTAGLPDPDLLIRTAGEMRVSNYLLWQISYAELFVTERTWPEFGPAELHEAIRDFSKRTRRFGAVVERWGDATQASGDSPA
jgi:undecaprenyl diphosphate synthase